MNNRQLAAAKRRLVRRLLLLVGPHQHETGYIRNSFPLDGKNKEYIRIWSIRDDHYSVILRNNLVIREIMGVTQDGIATDAFGGGLALAPWSSIPLEDLNRIERFVERRLSKTRSSL